MNLKLMIIIFLLNNCNCSRILGISTPTGKSHFNIPERIFIELAKRGHEVDVYSHFPHKQKIERYTDVSLRGTLPLWINRLNMSVISQFNSIWNAPYFMWSQMGKNHKQLFESVQLKQLKNSKKKYDLVIIQIMSNEAMAGFGKWFNAPMIGYITSVSLPWTNDRFGNPDNPSYIPNYFLPYSEKMNFFQRVVNSVLVLVLKIWYNSIASSYTDIQSKNFFGKDFPHVKELMKNFSLVLVNSHFSINQARPTSPNFIEIGGLHINDTKEKLNEKFEKILTEAKNGIILMSFGSMVQTESFPEEIKNAFLEAFSKIPYTILWKANRNSFIDKQIPNNIVMEEWIPQLNLLCHPKVKLFITHGGLHGVQESVYCGVPFLGFPIFSDQSLNVHNFVTKGLALDLNLHDLTTEKLSNSLNELLNNTKYKKNAKYYSELFKNRPMSPLDTAIYWIEYVLKFKGAPHLRPQSAELPWYKLHLIDVGLTILVFVILILIILYYFIKMIIIKIMYNLINCKPKIKIA